jgi:hypothetical protein
MFACFAHTHGLTNNAQFQTRKSQCEGEVRRYAFLTIWGGLTTPQRIDEINKTLEALICERQLLKSQREERSK